MGHRTVARNERFLPGVGWTPVRADGESQVAGTADTGIAAAPVTCNARLVSTGSGPAATESPHPFRNRCREVRFENPARRFRWNSEHPRRDVAGSGGV